MIHDKLVNKIVNELKKIPQIKAIVLGGSYATGTQRPDSDLDLGLFYNEYDPIKKADIEIAITNLGANNHDIIAEIGEWGKWMNGGVWLIIEGKRVDFIYRNIQFVDKTIDDCLRGKVETDYYQQPAYGFFNYIYCAEIEVNKPLFDPEKIITQLKHKVSSYPIVLKNNIIKFFLWDTQFSLSRAQKSAKRSEYHVVYGCVTRIINDLIQVTYALNKTFYFGEKKFYKDINTLTIKPQDFMSKINKILTTNSVDFAERLVNEFLDLTKGVYEPKYSRNLDNEKS